MLLSKGASMIQINCRKTFKGHRPFQLFVAKNLSRIESGLTLVKGSEAGGIEYHTRNSKGRQERANILAIDQQGNYVVIEVKWPEARPDALGKVMKDMAWVEAKTHQWCRGLIVAGTVHQSLQDIKNLIPDIIPRQIEFCSLLKVNPREELIRDLKIRDYFRQVSANKINLLTSYLIGKEKLHPEKNLWVEMVKALAETSNIAWACTRINIKFNLSGKLKITPEKFRKKWRWIKRHLNSLVQVSSGEERRNLWEAKELLYFIQNNTGILKIKRRPNAL